MNDHYKPKTIEAKLGWVVEECGEVLAAIGKTQRWGLKSVDPTIFDHKKQETNRAWIMRELRDLKKAITLLESAPEMQVDAEEQGWIDDGLGSELR